MASIERAELLLMQHRQDLAERELRGVLTDDPDCSRAHSLLALCILKEQSRWLEATDEAQMAIGIDPDEPFAHYVLGHVYLTRNRVSEAKPAAEEAIRLDPYDADYFGLLAAVEMQGERWSASLDAATQGLEIDPENVQCNNLRSIALERLGRGNEARQAAENTLRRSPENATSHAAMGWTALTNGDHQRAQIAFREALRLDPHNELARQGLVNALNSRSFVFRTIYRFYVWLSRFSAQYQFAIVLGAWLLAQGLKQVQRALPELSILITPALLLYFLFVILTWIATPLFNTFLRFHSFGRLLLSRKEMWASNLLAMCLSGAVFGGIYGGWQLGALGGIFAFGYWIMMMIPVSAIFNQHTAKRVGIALAATVLVGAVPVYAVAKCLADQSYEPLSAIMPMFGWGILGIQILSSIAHNAPVRN